MNVTRATTPTLTLTFTEETLDLTTASEVYVTLEQNNKSLTKESSDLTIAAKQIDVYLTQEDTLQFVDGPVKIQVNWKKNNDRFSSNVGVLYMTEQLLRAVI